VAGISLSINRGIDMPQISDITVGTSVPGTGDIEVRWQTLDTNSKPLTRKDVILALGSFIRSIENGSLQSPAGTPVQGSPVL
jgi:hypothetical protein